MARTATSVDYDEKADVLYVSFQRPQKATDTREESPDVLVRYRGREVVGITVLNASKKGRKAKR